MRRALRSRDRGCRFPGCQNRRFVDAHHIRHWSDGGDTKVDNLVLLCRRHHRLVHEGRYWIERREGQLVFRSPRGSPIASVPQAPRGSPRALVDGEIDRHTCRGGTPEPMYLYLTVAVLMQALR